MKKEEKLICPSCNKPFFHVMDKFSIEKRGRCVDCYKIWAAKPENDPELIRFDVEFSFKENHHAVIYAKNPKEARSLFEDEYGTDCEIETFKAIPREGFGSFNTKEL